MYERYPSHVHTWICIKHCHVGLFHMHSRKFKIHLGMYMVYLSVKIIFSLYNCFFMRINMFPIVHCILLFLYLHACCTYTQEAIRIMHITSDLNTCITFSSI